MRTPATLLLAGLLAGGSLLATGCGGGERAGAPAVPPEAATTPSPTGAPGELRQSPVQAEVVVYTARWCGWCRKTLAWLDERGVAYDNRDIEADPRHREELIAKSGGTGIPLVEIGDVRIQGYAPEQMARLLAR